MWVCAVGTSGTGRARALRAVCFGLKPGRAAFMRGRGTAGAGGIAQQINEAAKPARKSALQIVVEQPAKVVVDLAFNHGVSAVMSHTSVSQGH
jgi:hypothetical protein